MFGRLRRTAAGAQRRARLFQHKLVQQLLLLVHGAVDALHLLDGQRIGRKLTLHIGKALVVHFTKSLEGLHEFVEGGGHRFGHGLGFRSGFLSVDGHRHHPLKVVMIMVRAARLSVRTSSVSLSR